MNNNRLIKGDAAIPLHPKGWRPLAASSWIHGFPISLNLSQEFLKIRNKSIYLH